MKKYRESFIEKIQDYLLEEDSGAWRPEDRNLIISVHSLE